MAGSTNFQVWNPSAFNQENDAEYSSDPQRTGGAIDGQPYPAETANKFQYQVSTGIAAFMQMMAAKGFVVTDTNLGTLASVLAAVQTTADMKNPLQVQSYASTMVLDASKYSGLQCTLSGSATIGLINWSPGQVITFIFIQDATGGHSVSFPGVVNWENVDVVANAITVQQIVGYSPHYVAAVAENKLGFIPLQNGGGIGQRATGANKIFVGLSSTATRLKATVDVTDFGNMVFDSDLNSATAGIDASIATTNGNVSALQAALTAFENLFAGNVANPGHFYIPVGTKKILVQFGTTPDLGGGEITVNFDVTFPNACFTVVASTYSSTDRITYVHSFNASSVTLGSNGTGSSATYIAIGW